MKKYLVNEDKNHQYQSPSPNQYEKAIPFLISFPA